MIRNTPQLKRFHQDQLKAERFTYTEALRIFEGLFQEARGLGIIRPDNVMEGFDEKLKRLRALRKIAHV